MTAAEEEAAEEEAAEKAAAASWVVARYGFPTQQVCKRSSESEFVVKCLSVRIRIITNYRIKDVNN